MYKEVVYFGAELLNYWAMTFWGMKLFASVYDIKVSTKKYIENILLALMCLPVAVILAGNSFYFLYSNSTTYIIIAYLFLAVKILCKKFSKESKGILSSIMMYVFVMRLIDLWIVAVISEANKISRYVYIDLIHKNDERLVFIIVLALCYYLIYRACKDSYFLKYLYDNNLYRRILCVYGYLGTSCFSIVYGLEYQENLLYYWIFYLICAFILIGIFLIYFVQIKGKEKERLLNMRNDMMEANYQGLQKAYDTNRMLQHDNKNHMLAMYELIKENKNEEALNYIDKWMALSKNFLAEICSGNEIIDIIVNSKVNEAKEKHINFEYDVELVGNIQIEDVDMCALLANLMDNAIEACEKIEHDSWIYLKISRKNDTLLILLSNSISKEMLQKKSFFETEKENPHLHGWGMKSIENVIHKYDGEFEKIQKEDRLEIFVTLPL